MSKLLKKIPPHNHAVNITSSSSGEHVHEQNCSANAGIESGSGIIRQTFDKDGTDMKAYPTGMYTISAGEHTHTISGTTGNKGGGNDYLPPYITVYAWYRTA